MTDEVLIFTDQNVAWANVRNHLGLPDDANLEHDGPYCWNCSCGHTTCCDEHKVQMDEVYEAEGWDAQSGYNFFTMWAWRVGSKWAWADQTDCPAQIRVGLGEDE